ncbi:hypothetical protein CVT25_014496 [Psilocybe cyanescens]|uniref:RlpA-like protein double-psi beta-barrel domain-containing protein n=1 Tax=Psilocybe cyanescens TaxID=93625 RepID=A0A409VP23_PSICY|nr:hypothetical protein CVT25_014496 [Psilocybe cyanescens]
MTQGGKTTIATISDTCMGCPYGGLDLTEGLFAFFLGHWPQGGGVLTGDWEFTDATKPAAPPPVKTMKSPPTPVTPTVHNPVVSSTKFFSTASISATSKTASSTSAPNSTISSSSASMSMAINYLSGVASGLAVPTGSIDTTDSSSNLEGLNSVFVQLGGLAMAAGIN